jgi:hypothetical protein
VLPAWKEWLWSSGRETTQSREEFSLAVSPHAPGQASVIYQAQCVHLITFVHFEAGRFERRLPFGSEERRASWASANSTDTVPLIKGEAAVNKRPSMPLHPISSSQSMHEQKTSP